MIGVETVNIYTDGAYSEEINAYSWGVVIIMTFSDFSSHIQEIKGADCNPKVISAHNIAGELKGVMVAVKYCVERHINIANLYYDYEGIEKWLTGEWRAKSDVSKMYVKWMIETCDKHNLSITYNKVTAHTGNKYNELADSLAKKALLEFKIK